MKVDLAPEAAEWVQSEIAGGRFATDKEAIGHAINAAKLERLRRALAAAEAEGGAFSGDEIRDFARRHLDNLAEKSAPGR